MTSRAIMYRQSLKSRLGYSKPNKFDDWLHSLLPLPQAFIPVCSANTLRWVCPEHQPGILCPSSIKQHIRECYRSASQPRSSTINPNRTSGPEKPTRDVAGIANPGKHGIFSKRSERAWGKCWDTRKDHTHMR